MRGRGTMRVWGTTRVCGTMRGWGTMRGHGTMRGMVPHGHGALTLVQQWGQSYIPIPPCQIWSLDSYECLREMHCSGGSVYSMTLTNKYLVCGTYENCISVSLHRGGRGEGRGAVLPVCYVSCRYGTSPVGSTLVHWRATEGLCTTCQH